MFTDAFSPEYQLIRADPKHGMYVSALLLLSHPQCFTRTWPLYDCQVSRVCPASARRCPGVGCAPQYRSVGLFCFLMSTRCLLRELLSLKVVACVPRFALLPGTRKAGKLDCAPYRRWDRCQLACWALIPQEPFASLPGQQHVCHLHIQESQRPLFETLSKQG